MAISLPSVNNLLPVNKVDSIIAIGVVGVLAGLTNPKQTWVAYANVVVATIATGVFEYYAIDAYNRYSASDILFWINQALAITFFFGLYYSTKTLRGKFVKIGPQELDPLEPEKHERPGQ